MSYYKQFQVFDPISGDVPSHPFGSLPAVAYRARALLKSRTIEQIESAALQVDWLLDDYFATIKTDELQRLKGVLNTLDPRDRDDLHEYENALNFFNWDGGSAANGMWLYNGRSLDIATPENTSELEVLKDVIGSWDEIGGEDFPDGKPYELFAVLSLWLLADAITWLDHREAESRKALPPDLQDLLGKLDRQESETENLVKNLGLTDDMAALFGSESLTPSQHERNLSLAGQSALDAMDAVCYAEHLCEMETLRTTHYQQEAKREEEEVKRRSMKAQKLNIQRHRNRNEARNKVIDEWEKDRSRWISAEKAGLYLAEWLEEHGFDYEPRTVTGWIRDHAKEISIRFR